MNTVETLASKVGDRIFSLNIFYQKNLGFYEVIARVAGKVVSESIYSDDLNALSFNQKVDFISNVTSKAIEGKFK